MSMQRFLILFFAVIYLVSCGGAETGPDNGINSGATSSSSSSGSSSGAASSSSSSSSASSSSSSASSSSSGSTIPEKAVVPSRVQAHTYSAFGGEDDVRNGATEGVCAIGQVDMNTTQDQDGQCHVGWTVSGEWLEYELSANSDGIYDLVFRIASKDPDKKLAVQIDGMDVGQVIAPAIGWDSYADVTLPKVSISTGDHTLRIRFLDGGVNLNFFEFKEPSLSSSSSSSSSGQAFDPRGHEGPLFGGMSEADRQGFYFQEAGGTVVVEGEHYMTQRYGSTAYRGAKWWMTQTTSFDAKSHPEFKQRCALAKTELMEMESGKKYGGILLKDIIAGGWGANQINTYWGPGPHSVPRGREATAGIGGHAVFEKWGCDPDGNHAQNASNGQYVELVPDTLNENYNEIPHGSANWKDGTKAPKAYYKVKLSGGNYKIFIRGYRTEGDSGSLHVGHTKQIGQNEKATSSREGKGVGFTENKKWSWKSHDLGSIASGTTYIIIAGREDGFEVDKIVVSKSGCGACSGAQLGPNESAKIK